ncbi:MAG: TetR/AcrR family transcriptional regulator [Pseudonocardia sp.]|nr:TetR/AcrR family transcriptional regulator [Pseudonocardia sp.]
MTSGIGRRRAAARDEGSQEYRERRAEIVRAAARIFMENGFRATKLNDIAEALNMDRASLYYYVGGKEELFHEVVGGAVAANADAAEAIRRGPGTAPEKLHTLITSLMVSYAENYPFLYVYIQENLSTVSPDRSSWSREMRRHNKRYENAVVEIVQSGIDEGSVRADTTAWVIAYGIIGMVAWSNRWFDPNSSPVDAQTIGTNYADVIVDGLRAR